MQASEDDGVVDLNVGGTLYSTTRTTLLRHDSMLAAMFSGRHELKRRADGRVFIDRDGELFKYVLQYLRDGDLDVDHLDQGLRKRLKREAAFYCLPGLEEKLMKALPRSIFFKVTVGPSAQQKEDIVAVCPATFSWVPPKPPLSFYEGDGKYYLDGNVQEYLYSKLLPAVASAFGQQGYNLMSYNQEEDKDVFHFSLQRM